MTGEATTLESLAERLDGLTDLFRRRLLEDRAKQAMIDELQARVQTAEKAVAADALRPLVTHIALVIERLQSGAPSEDLLQSVTEELEDVLELFGVTTIGRSERVDPRRHEILSVSGEGPVLRFGELIRVGYERDGVVLRPAKVTAVRDVAAVSSADAVPGADA